MNCYSGKVVIYTPVMTKTRFFAYLLGLLLLLLLGTGFYLYNNLSAILTNQAQHYLQEYGVEDINFEQLEFDGRQLRLGTLWLRGAHEGLAFEADLASLTIAYDWRALLSGTLHSVDIAKLDISINQTTASADSSPESLPINMENIIPYHLVNSLPIQSLRITEWNLDYTDPELPFFQIGGNLLLKDRLDVSLTASTLDSHLVAAVSVNETPPFVTMEIALQDSENNNGNDIANLSALLHSAADEQWEWGLKGRWAYTPLLQWLHRISDQTDIPLNVTNMKDLRLHGQSAFTATVNHPGTLNISFTPGQPGLDQFQANIALSSEILDLTYADTINNLVGTLQTTVALEHGNLKVALDTSKLEGILHGENARFSLQPLNFQANILVDEPLQLDTRMSTNIVVHLDEQAFPQLQLTLHQQGRFEESELELRLTDSAENLTVDLHGTMNLTTGSGDMHMDTNSADLPALLKEVNPLLQHFGLMKQSVTLSSGTVRLKTKLQSTDSDPANWQQSSQLSVENVSGTIDELTFEGLALAANWTGIENVKTEHPIELSLKHLFTGFDVRNIQAKMSMPRATPVTRPSMRMASFTAELFGGKLSLPAPQPWDFSASSNSVTLLADQWQLADLVALQSDKDIQAEGILEGKLPITIIDGRITIDDGYLRALPPGGTIRYVANDASRALARSNPELKLALDLLSDFQYQVLKSAVDLDQAGNLLLGLTLAGSNPSEYDGQAVNFNINLEQNIDPLLQSLRLSDKLVERIEDSLK